MTSEELDRQMTELVADLCRELPSEVSPDDVGELVDAHYGRLRSEATVTEFIPLLVHRYAREELIRISNGELTESV